MYEEDDIARSVRRYVAEMLGPPWALDLERREVRDSDRPAGSVELGSVQVRDARTSIPQGDVTLFMPVTVVLYPSLAEPRLAGRTARQLTMALRRLVLNGADGPTFVSGRPASGPERIPLYDYADVPLEGSPEDRTGPEHPHDVLWAEDYSVHPLQDPIDPERWTVILELRVSWSEPGRVNAADADAPLVTSLPGGYIAPNGPAAGSYVPPLPPD